MHAISSYRGNIPTHPETHTHTHTHTNRQDRLQYTAPQLARSVTRCMGPARIARVSQQCLYENCPQMLE